MTATGISQKEYLKKYLSSGGDDKKKKKKKPRTKPVVNRLRIVDDDVDIHNMRPLNDDELELYNLQEDAPQIAGIIDERPEEVKIKEKYGSKKWKVVADENDMGVKIIDKSNPKDVTEVSKNSVLHVPEVNNDDDLSPPRKSRKDDKMPMSGESPPRRNRRESLENSPSNKRGQKCDFDESPLRKSKKSDKESVLISKSCHTRDSDESPPRRNQKGNSETTRHRRKGQYRIAEESPRHKSKKDDWDSMQQRQNYNSDESLPRKVKTSMGNMPPYRRQQNYHSDESPPRRKKRSYPEDISPHEKGQKYISEMSPQTRSRKNSSENAQPYKNSQKYDSEDSPPRKTKQKDSESPPRRDVHSKLRMNHRKDTSPSRNKRCSPPSSRLKGANEYMGRKSQKSDSDESPPRREMKRSSRSPSIKNRKERDIEEVLRKTSRWGKADVSRNATRDFLKYKLSPTHQRERGNLSHKDFGRNDHKKDERNPPRRSNADVSPERKTKQTNKVDAKKQTLDGRKAGLMGADELKAEIADLRHREKEMFEKMDVSVSGRGAAPVMRDRKTGKKRDLEEEAREKQEKDEKQAERDAKYMQWGRGLKQVTDKAQKMEEDIYEMSKPLARYADDADLDKFLREQDREGDPMLEYIRCKSKSQGESSKPRYEGSFMPNRFGIRPGYRWDGVDRSNGYEKQWFETQNAKKAVEEEAYKWSTADM